MKRLFIRITLFLLPILLYFSLPVYLLFKFKELNRFDKITALHNNDEHSLIGLLYSDPARYMKLHSTKERGPEVLALGTSRVMQIREFFFTTGTKFYNAGGGVERLQEFKVFLSKIPDEKLPQLMIISLDQNFFNKNWDDLSRGKFDAEYKDKSNVLSCVFSRSWGLWEMFYKGELSLTEDIPKDRIGMAAIVLDNGFRADGSYKYGSILKNPRSQDYRFKGVFDKIERHEERFEYASTINPEAMAVLDDLLAFCSQKKIHVIGFIPPYAHAVVEKIRSKGDKYDYIFRLPASLKPSFTKYNYSLYDFTDAAALDAADDEMLDGIHGSEKIYLRMMIRMAEDDPLLKRYCDTAQLKELLDHSPSGLEVRGDSL